MLTLEGFKLESFYDSFDTYLSVLHTTKGGLRQQLHARAGGAVYPSELASALLGSSAGFPGVNGNAGDCQFTARSCRPSSSHS